MRLPSFAASAFFLAACGAQAIAPSESAGAYPNDAAFALAGPRALSVAPQQRYPITIDQRAWTPFTAYSSQVNLLDEGKPTGLAVDGGTFYRLNTRNPDYDYFFLDMSGFEKVRDFNGCPYDARRAARYCEYINGGFTMETSLAVGGTTVGSVIEDSPRGRVDTRVYNVAVGASLGSEISCEAGWTRGVMVAEPAIAPCKKPLSAQATYAFFPESVTGDNLTHAGGTSVEWKGEFASIDRPHCKGTFPRESTSEGSLGAFAIIRVPRTALYGGSDAKLTLVDKIAAYNRSIRVAAGSCAGLTTFDHRDSQNWSTTVLLPEFHVSASARGLHVGSDGTVTLTIDSHSHYDVYGLAPSLQLQRDGRIVDPKSAGLSFTPDTETAAGLGSKTGCCFPPHGTWTIAAHNAQKGTYAILVDTAPGGQADSLRAGPISVTLTVE